MTVYIEYAFLENFLLDGVLLWLSLLASKTPVRWGRLLFSAALGGCVALLFPLLRLPVFLSVAFKLSVGALLPMLCFSRLRTKKQWGRYALSAAFFFGFTFAFGGALLGAGTALRMERLPKLVVWLGFALLTAISFWLLVKFYEKRSIFQNIYDCIVACGEKRIRVKGFFDSGNRAQKNGLPVCFLSTDILYELFGEELLFQGEALGQVCDELEISTQAGRKKVPLYRGVVQIEKGGGKEVYFAPSANMISREYKLLLHSGALEGEETWAA